MGSQILKISPFAASRTFKPNAPALARFHPNPINRIPKPRTCQIFRNRSNLSGGLSLYQGKKGFRSGIVAMAATGSVQKSEEEWRAVLSPEQFRILRQKGTEYVLILCPFAFIFYHYVFWNFHWISWNLGNQVLLVLSVRGVSFFFFGDVIVEIICTCVLLSLLLNFFVFSLWYCSERF